MQLMQFFMQHKKSDFLLDYVLFLLALSLLLLFIFLKILMFRIYPNIIKVNLKKY